jgi:hypothetical protein
MRFQIYPDTCGRGLKLEVSRSINIRILIGLATKGII